MPTYYLAFGIASEADYIRVDPAVFRIQNTEGVLSCDSSLFFQQQLYSAYVPVHTRFECYEAITDREILSEAFDALQCPNLVWATTVEQIFVRISPTFRTDLRLRELQGERLRLGDPSSWTDSWAGGGGRPVFDQALLTAAQFQDIRIPEEEAEPFPEWLQVGVWVRSAAGVTATVTSIVSDHVMLVIFEDPPKGPTKFLLCADLKGWVVCDAPRPRKTIWELLLNDDL